jgi:oligopeptide/dipeptide ABC transporter ATP-binding protein
MTLLDVEDLRILLRRGNQEVPLVDGVSLTIDPGSVVGLAGESGSGKTLTGLSALGFLPDRSRATGEVRFAGRNVLAMSQSQLRRLRGHQVAVVFQDPMTSLHPMLSVGRQLTEHVEFHLGLSDAEARDRAIELLRTVRLPDPENVLSSFPHQFSGGMRQRIAIAIALACRPQLLIADEPTTALDVTVQAGILRLLDRLRRESDMAVLLISHDLGVMSALADTLHVMYAGRIVESGPVSGLLTAPRHPYTRSLLDSLPDPTARGTDLRVIRGEPPPPDRRPPGCPFSPRCAFVEPRCLEAVPPLEPRGADRAAACVVDPFKSSLRSPATQAAGGRSDAAFDQAGGPGGSSLASEDV